MGAGRHARALLLLGLTLAVGGTVRAQGLGREPSSLGPAPGASGVPDLPGGSEPLLGGRPGTGTPHVPVRVTRPGEALLPSALPSIEAVTEIPGIELPVYGSLSLPAADAPGSPVGDLTLETAVARLLAANLDLRSNYLELPQARADVLTAGLRGNPILFYGAQFIPYRPFTEEQPGGPTQHDLNVTLPLDLNRKRRVRVEFACQAARVLEAQYQDAVRLTIGQLYAAYVDVQAAGETVRFARASVEGLEKLLEDEIEEREQGGITLAEVNRVKVRRDAARIGLREAESSLLQAKIALMPLLNLRAAEALALEPRIDIEQAVPPLPDPESLVRLALEARPDLAAYRLGLRAAETGVRLARAERFEDVFLLYQPYQSQDLRPFDQGVVTAWAAGVTVPLPVFNRNQGNIQRARINVVQTRHELARQEQLVVAEVLQAYHRLESARLSTDEIARDLLPTAREAANDALRRHRLGDTDVDEYLEYERELNDLVRQYRDTLIRRRRGMLDLNTAVGLRLLP